MNKDFLQGLPELPEAWWPVRSFSSGKFIWKPVRWRGSSFCLRMIFRLICQENKTNVKLDLEQKMLHTSYSNHDSNFHSAFWLPVSLTVDITTYLKSCGSGDILKGSGQMKDDNISINYISFWKVWISNTYFFKKIYF